MKSEQKLKQLSAGPRLMLCKLIVNYYWIFFSLKNKETIYNSTKLRSVLIFRLIVEWIIDFVDSFRSAWYSEVAPHFNWIFFCRFVYVKFTWNWEWVSGICPWTSIFIRRSRLHCWVSSPIFVFHARHSRTRLIRGNHWDLQRLLNANLFDMDDAESFKLDEAAAGNGKIPNKSNLA